MFDVTGSPFLRNAVPHVTFAVQGRAKLVVNRAYGRGVGRRIAPGNVKAVDGPPHLAALGCNVERLRRWCRVEQNLARGARGAPSGIHGSNCHAVASVRTKYLRCEI